MVLIYGFALVLFMFEGIIIQCKCADDTTAPNLIQHPPNIDIDDKKPYLPNDLIELILSKTDFETIQKAVQKRTIAATDIVMSRILPDHIIEIRPDLNTPIFETYISGSFVLQLNNLKGFISFFDKFGDQVKKILVWLGGDDPCNLIKQNIIKEHAKNLEELRIIALEFWEDTLLGGNNIFPEVKNFYFLGDDKRNELKLNLIFPKLETFELYGTVADENCLDNVTGLKELTMLSPSIPGHKLDHIFENNENMRKMSISWPAETEPIKTIAKYLTKLEILEIQYPDKYFLLQANNAIVYKMPSVTQLNIIFGRMDEAFGIENLPFNMPNLKKLTLSGSQTDDRIINFIKHFKDVDKVELLVKNYKVMEFIENLTDIKEFTTFFHENEIVHLKHMFEHFDEKSKLQTLKLLPDSESLYKNCVDTMEEFNNYLGKSMKPTWTLSQEFHKGSGQKCIKFEREPCN